ncbi:MAG: hypothetical protein LBG05_00550, partial [Treponema sp.]|nr:hypothetical protein [Treponema sp.]
GIKTNFPNIGGIKLYKKSNQNIYELLNLLTLRWNYMLNENEQKDIFLFFKKHYNNFYYEYTKDYEKSIVKIIEPNRLLDIIETGDLL